MSITLLLEKYDVSTDEGLQKALSEIEKEECEVNEALCTALSRACTLEGRLRTASQAYIKLGEVRNDAQVAADMVDKTALLARDVSAKVRQLDLARSRVAECQRRVHDLIDLRVCSAGVDTAIKAHDYETAAGHVARFLSMEPGSVAAARARGAPDPRRDMDAAANTLRDHLVRKFEEAAKKEDEAAIERLFKLFPQIGRAEEGVDLLAKYLAAQLEVSIRRAATVPELRLDAAVFADSLTRVLECGAAAVERARRLLAAATAPPSVQTQSLLPRAIAIIQPTICQGVRRVSQQMISARKLVVTEKTDPLSVEHSLNELALAHSRLQLYFGFLRRRPELDANMDESAKAACLEAIEKIISDCDMTRTAQDVLSHYLTLERYFLEESVNKALKLSSAQAGDAASSLVDDVFFIARKVIRRSISTGSVDGLCCVLNEAGAALERCGSALRRRLASPPPDPLPLPAPPAQQQNALAPLGRRATEKDMDARRARYLVSERRGRCGSALRRRLASPPPDPLPLPPPPAQQQNALAPLGRRATEKDMDARRARYLAHMNEAEAGAEWAERLAAEACREAEPLCRAEPARAKLRSCAAGLGAAAAAFRAAHDLALAAVRAALAPRAAAWARALVDPDTDIEELEEEAGALPAALEVLAEEARAHIPQCADALLGAVLADLLTAAEQTMLNNHYERVGGACVERRVRRVAAWAGGGAPAARERCGALSAAAALLAVERLAHVADALPPRAPLSPARVRDVLARRTDFKLEDIKRLKL